MLQVELADQKPSERVKMRSSYLEALKTGAGQPLLVFLFWSCSGTDEALLEAMLAHPIPINRPFVVNDLGTRLCRPSELVLDILPPVTTPFTREDGQVVLHRQGRRRQVARQHLPEQRKKWVKPFQILRPLSSQPPSTLVALVCSAARSEPASGSLMPMFTANSHAGQARAKSATLNRHHQRHHSEVPVWITNRS